MISDSPMINCCPVGCNSTLAVTDIHLPEGNLRRCSHCDQLVSACTPEHYKESMQEFNVPEGTLPSDKAQTRHNQRISNILNNASIKMGTPANKLSLLDVGCSSGSVLQVAKGMNFANVVGVEPAKKAAQTAINAGFTVHPCLLHEAKLDDDSFDIITLFEVIEHLDSPLDLAREIFRILRPGGLWIIGTGNASSWTAKVLNKEWSYFSIAHNGGHISFFNPKSMQIFAEHAGFGTVEIQTKRVLLAEKETTSSLIYRSSKLASELFAIPARISNKGHDMLAILQKPE